MVGLAHQVQATPLSTLRMSISPIIGTNMVHVLVTVLTLSPMVITGGQPNLTNSILFQKSTFWLEIRIMPKDQNFISMTSFAPRFLTISEGGHG